MQKNSAQRAPVPTESGRTRERRSKVWIDALSKQGYAVRVCLGWEDAARTLEKYLQLGEFGKKQEAN